MAKQKKVAFVGLVLLACILALYLIIFHEETVALQDMHAQPSVLSVFAPQNDINKMIPPYKHLTKEIQTKLHLIKSPPNVESDVMQDEALKKKTKYKREKHVKYGGSDIDPPHLGGFIDNDTDTYEPYMWDWFINLLNITSVIDIGCGKGYSTTWFESRPQLNNVLCVEGSLDAVQNSLVPSITVHHDYSKGAWWPEEEYDMVWSAEFLEHVDEAFIPNYLSTMKRAKWLLVTHSVVGGWHHSCVHDSHWWIEKFSQYGFEYRDYMTQRLRRMCVMGEKDIKESGWIFTRQNAEGETVIGRKDSHFRHKGLVFANTMYFNKLTPFDEAILQAYN